MRLSQLIAPGHSEVIDAPDPVIGPTQILVAVKACGVCASELHPWLDGSYGFPTRFGHEPAGVVVQTGAAVTGFNPGDRVTGFFAPAFSELAVAEAWQLALIPDGLPFQLALGEPVACLVNALLRSRIEVGDRVALVGLGFMGLGLLSLVRLKGPRQIVAIDPRPEARAKALQLGADVAYAPDEVPGELFVTQFSEWDSPKGCEVVIEGSGTQAGLSLAEKLVRAHGVLSVMGWHQGGLRTVDLHMAGWKACDIVNSHMRRQSVKVETLRIGLDLIAAGKFSLGPLVTHTFPLDQVDRAYQAMKDKPEGFTKAVIEIG